MLQSRRSTDDPAAGLWPSVRRTSIAIGSFSVEAAGKRARAFHAADVEEEPQQEGRPDGQEDDQEHAIAPGLQDPDDHEEHAGGRQDCAEYVEGLRRVRGQRIDDSAAEENDRPSADPRSARGRRSAGIGS